MAYPHKFEYLRDPERPAVFILGAGASYGMNPLPKEIITTHRASAETTIAAISRRPFPALRVSPDVDEALYVWAEQAEDELLSAGHRCPKLQIAQSLGITTDPKWLAGVSRPASASMPRHRVLARLAREGCLESIWTFNWDCHIESALESIGLKEQEKVPEQPWPVRYQRIGSLRDYGKYPQERTIFVHKRHGCVKSLKDLEGLDASGKASAEDYAGLRFLITHRELADVQDKTTAEYKSFQGQIDSEFAGRPLTICGWSASEKYLLNEFAKCAARIQNYPNGADRLSVVDPVFNTEGHVALAAIYRVTKDQAHFSIAPTAGMPDVDDLFLWIQSLYALSSIQRVLDAHRTLQVWVEDQLRAAEATAVPSNLTQMIDVLLPAWVQHCWRAGLVATSYRGKKLKPEDIKLEGPEWYVPLAQSIPDRPELISAAFLFRAISGCGRAFRFDFVAGTLFFDGDASLVIPLPAWGDLADANYLNSLTRIADSVNGKRGFISRVQLLALSIDGTLVDDARKGALLSTFRSISTLPMSLPVEVISLDAI